MPTPLRPQLAHYIDHLMDAAWLATLVEEHGLPAILAEVADILERGAAPEIQEALLFTRDLGQNINRWAADIIDDVREALPIVVIPHVRPLLTAPNFALRRNAVYTLGKLCFRQDAKALRDAFPYLIEKDPLVLPDLLRELAWLNDHRGVRARAKRMLEHKAYLVRWALLGAENALPRIGGREGLRLWHLILETLARDPVPAVRAEASFHQESDRILQAARKARWQPKPDWKKRVRSVEKTRPSLTFAMLDLRFCNSRQPHLADYSIEELLAFARAAGVAES